MAGNIKGITVSIGGEAKGLQSVMSSIEKNSKSLQTELNLVNKQLKFDPSNAVLLAQKQEILEEKIENSKLALQQLEEVRSQVEEKAKNGDIGADKYRGYQREVEKTKEVLRSLEKQLVDVKTAQNEFENDLNEINLTPAKKEIEKLNDEVSDFEKNAQKTDLSPFKKEIDDVKTSAKNLKDELKNTAAGIGAGLTAVGGGVVASIKSFDSVESALNHLQAQTGMSNKEINQLKSGMEATYKGNFGDDLTEIANVMAAVAQQTKETDPKKIQELTENLFTLNDTFGYDYAESLRAIDMLTKQWGLTSGEALNLIVQGTQKGLNKNGDLLDTINEYSVHYKQLGYSSEEFFNSLENGANSGTFSIDKLGDAMKEFGIRSKDNAKSSIEAFELLGYVTDETAKKGDNSSKSISKLQGEFAAGGDKARAATQEVLTALFKLDDKVLQNQIGVQLFGTMWEDLGIDGVKALMNVTGQADKTTSSMKKIKDVKYDDVSNKLATLGRTAQTEIINPMLEKAYPKIKDGIEWVSENLDNIVPIVTAIGREMGIVWSAKKINDITNGIVDLYKSYKSLQIATQSATTAQQALNIAQKSNIIGLVIGLIGTLGNVIWSACEAAAANKEETIELTEEQKNLYEAIDEQKDAWDELTQKRKDSAADIESEFGHYEGLYEELKKITDKNGKVKDSYEDRAKVITGQLSKALGKEIELNNGVIKNYQDIQTEIKKTLELKKAEAIANAYGDSYNQAVSKKDEAFSNYYEAQKNVKNLEEEYKKAEEKRKELLENLKKEKKSLPPETMDYMSRFGSGIDKAQKKLNDARNKLSESENIYVSYLSTIENYEKTQEALLSGNVDKVNEALNRMTNGFITAENGTYEALNNQVIAYSSHYEELKTAIEEGAPGVTEKMVAEAERMVSLAQGELIKFSPVARQAATDGVNGYADRLNDDEANEKVKSGAEKLKNSANAGMGNQFKEGHKNGTDYSRGYIKGLEDRYDDVQIAGYGMAFKAIYGTKYVQESNSPSKKAKKLGHDYGDGYALGITDKQREVIKASSEMAKGALNALNDDKLKNIKSIMQAQSRFKNVSVNNLSGNLSELKGSISNSKYSSVNKTFNSNPNINVSVETGNIENQTDIRELADTIANKIGETIMIENMAWG